MKPYLILLATGGDAVPETAMQMEGTGEPMRMEGTNEIIELES